MCSATSAPTSSTSAPTNARGCSARRHAGHAGVAEAGEPPAASSAPSTAWCTPSRRIASRSSSRRNGPRRVAARRPEGGPAPAGSTSPSSPRVQVSTWTSSPSGDVMGHRDAASSGSRRPGGRGRTAAAARCRDAAAGRARGNQMTWRSSGKWQATRWPGASSTGSGHLVGALLLRLGAPGPEDAAARRVLRDGQVALEQDPLAAWPPCSGPGWAPPTAGRGCRGAAGARRASSRGASSMTLPRYITTTRSEMCRTTDRSWAMKT